MIIIDNIWRAIHFFPFISIMINIKPISQALPGMHQHRFLNYWTLKTLKRSFCDWLYYQLVLNGWLFTVMVITMAIILSFILFLYPSFSILFVRFSLWMHLFIIISSTLLLHNYSIHLNQYRIPHFLSPWFLLILYSLDPFFLDWLFIDLLLLILIGFLLTILTQFFILLLIF